MRRMKRKKKMKMLKKVKHEFLIKRTNNLLKIKIFRKCLFFQQIKILAIILDFLCK